MTQTPTRAHKPQPPGVMPSPAGRWPVILGRGLSGFRCNWPLESYLSEGLMRPSKVMAKALSAAFHRITHRARPRPVGSSDLVTVVSVRVFAKAAVH
jgi:hypothetical protein